MYNLASLTINVLAGFIHIWSNNLFKKFKLYMMILKLKHIYVYFFKLKNIYVYFFSLNFIVSQ
jgi:hypothetical protein